MFSALKKFLGSDNPEDHLSEQHSQPKERSERRNSVAVDLSPEDVINRRFGATKFRGGYDQDEVDDFLDEIVVELRRLQQEEGEFRLARERGSFAAKSIPRITPEDVINKRFNPTKFREGYDQNEVDDFLDEIVVELTRRNKLNSSIRSSGAEPIEETDKTV